jgi:subtilisin family serine protease
MKKEIISLCRRTIGYSASLAILLFVVIGCDNLTSPDASISDQPVVANNQLQNSNISQVNPTFAQPGNRPDVIEGHYIVILSELPARDNPRAAAALEALSKDVGNMQGARLNRKYKNVLTGFAAELSEEQAEQLRRDPRVQSVEQDRYAYPASDFTLQEYPTWGLDRIDQREPLLDRAYAYTTTGAGVTAYIIDSGIFYDHPEFGGRASLGYDFVLEDDPDNTDPGQGPGEDCSGHGTHVAGTVCGSTYGVAKNVNIVSVRVFGCTGGAPWSRIIAAVEWVTENAEYPAVSNMSIGGWAIDAVDAAIENSIATGIHYAVAAGNNGDNACLYSPARTSGAMTVGAAQVGDYKASFSNYGDCVDLYAPGASILSAVHTDEWSGDGSYTLSASGTSMAAPHVAGIAALYLETNPDVTPLDLHAEIVNNSTKNTVSNVPSGTNHLAHSLWETLEFTHPPALEVIELTSTTALKEKGSQTIDLTWEFNSQSNVEIIRNGTMVTIWYNAGYYRDNTDIKGNDGYYVHQVCERYYINNSCSNEMTTIFGDGGDDDGNDPNIPPEADFTYHVDGLTVQFADVSTDSDGTIVSWNWNFGDGNSSSSQNPDHTYSESGTYSVSLTVTDDDGDTGSTSKNVSVSDGDPVPPGDITLSAEGYKVQGRWRADLTWMPSGTSANVDVFRDGTVITTTQNNGSYTDATHFRGGGSLTYKVCEAGTDACSNEVTVQF